MIVLEYIESRKSTVGQWYSKETDDLKLSCFETDKVIDILAWLADEQEASLAVVDQKHRLIGIISERDVIKHLSRHRFLAEDLLVKDLMTEDVKSATPDFYCLDALKIMVKGDFRNLPIVIGDEFVGILSIVDAAKARLLETVSRSNDVFNALKSFGADLPSIDINLSMHEAFEVLARHKAPFLTVKHEDEIIDYLAAQEINRIKLREK